MIDEGKTSWKEQTKEVETPRRRDRRFVMRQDREVGRDINRSSVCISREGQRGESGGPIRAVSVSHYSSMKSEDEGTQHVCMYVSKSSY